MTRARITVDLDVPDRWTIDQVATSVKASLGRESGHWSTRDLADPRVVMIALAVPPIAAPLTDLAEPGRPNGD